MFNKIFQKSIIITRKATYRSKGFSIFSPMNGERIDREKKNNNFSIF